jgi:uncharacterized protein
MDKKISLIQKKIVPILQRHDIKRASIFGSFARGEATARSDVDLLIEYRKNNKSLFDLVNLKLELEAALKRTVDVLTYNSIHWKLRDRILAEHVVIF